MSDLRYTAQPATRTEIPRPKRGEGQWALGYTEPLNKNEQSKKDDDPLNVRARILHIYSKRGFASIDPADLRGRFRWLGLYTQRAPGFDGGKTAMLEEEELDDEFFMMRVRSDGQLLSPDAVRALGTIGAGVRPRHRRRHRPREHPVPLDPDRGRPRDLGAGSSAVGLTTLEACGDSPAAVPRLPRRRRRRRRDHRRLRARSRRSSAAILGNPAYSNLPRKFKTALTGHPSHDVAPEINDVAFVGTVHPEHGPGFDLWVGGGLSTNPMLAAEARRLDPARRGRRRLGGRRRDLPRLRLPPAPLAGPAEVPGRRLGRRQVPRGARERVPRPAARALRVARRRPRATATTSACTTQQDGKRYVGLAPTAGRVSGTLLVQLADLMELLRRRRRPAHAVPEDRADRRRPRRGRRRCSTRSTRSGSPAARRLAAQHDGLHRHRVLQAGDRRHQEPRPRPGRRAGAPLPRPRRPRSRSTSTAAPTPAPAPRSPTSASRASW